MISIGSWLKVNINMNDDKMIYYWAHMLDETMNVFSAGKAYLDSVLPKNGVIIYDEHGKKT